MKIPNPVLALAVSSAVCAAAWAGDKPVVLDHMPKIETIDGVTYVDGKKAEIVDGKIYMDGKPFEFTMVRTSEQAAEDRVELPAAPAGVDRLMAHVPPSRLGKSLSLPKLFVIDTKTGKRADLNDLPSPLAKWLQAPQQQQSLRFAVDGPLLSIALKDVLDAEGKPLAGRNFSDARFLTVQWWAGWCHPCLQEATELGKMFAEHPMPDVRWIAVEADPTREEAVAKAGNP